MALSDIKKKIEAEALEEARRIHAAADKEIALINVEAEKNVRDTHDSYNERFAKERPEILRRREIVANLDVARCQLGAKQDLISKAFGEALNILSNLPHERYLGFVADLLKKAIRSGHEILFVGKDESKITHDWLNHFNSENNTSLTIADERLAIAGGFVMRDDKIDTNCSWEMLVRWIRDDIESDVVEKLFGKPTPEKKG